MRREQFEPYDVRANDLLATRLRVGPLPHIADVRPVDFVSMRMASAEVIGLTGGKPNLLAPLDL